MDGETEAAVDAREEDVTSASCSRRSSWSWVSAKWAMERGVGGAMLAWARESRLCQLGQHVWSVSIVF